MRRVEKLKESRHHPHRRRARPGEGRHDDAGDRRRGARPLDAVGSSAPSRRRRKAFPAASNATSSPASSTISWSSAPATSPTSTGCTPMRSSACRACARSAPSSCSRRFCRRPRYQYRRRTGRAGSIAVHARLCASYGCCTRRPSQRRRPVAAVGAAEREVADEARLHNTDSAERGLARGSLLQPMLRDFGAACGMAERQILNAQHQADGLGLGKAIEQFVIECERIGRGGPRSRSRPVVMA